MAWGIALPQANIYQKAESFLKIYFGDSAEISESYYKYTNTDSIYILTCRNNDNVVGYGIMDNVKGKNQPITYMTIFDTLGDVLDVNILVYRESHGGEVQNESFRRQFRGKNSTSKLEVGKDIKSISGASISSRSITNGVKKIIKIFNSIKPEILNPK